MRRFELRVRLCTIRGWADSSARLGRDDYGKRMHSCEASQRLAMHLEALFRLECFPRGILSLRG